MKRKQVVLILAALTALLLAFAGCSKPSTTSKPAGTPATFPSIPAAATSVVQVQIGALVNDADIASAYATAVQGTSQPQTLKDALDQMTKSSGIDIRTFSQATLFANTGQQGQEYSAVVGKGTFQEQDVVNAVQKKSGALTTSTYNGYKLYSSSDGKTALAFPASGQVVIGSPSAVKDELDVIKGSAQPAAGQLKDAFVRLSAGLVNGASLMPQGTPTPTAVSTTTASGTPSMGSMGSLGAFSKIDTAAFTVSKSGKDIFVELDTHYGSNQDARDASDTLVGLITVLRANTTDQTAKAALGRVDISANGQWVVSSWSGALSDAASVAQSLQKK